MPMKKEVVFRVFMEHDNNKPTEFFLKTHPTSQSAAVQTQTLVGTVPGLRRAWFEKIVRNIPCKPEEVTRETGERKRLLAEANLRAAEQRETDIDTARSRYEETVEQAKRTLEADLDTAEQTYKNSLRTAKQTIMGGDEQA